jgi:hypothetical protein
MHFDMKNTLKSNRNHTPKKLQTGLYETQLKKQVKTVS